MKKVLFVYKHKRSWTENEAKLLQKYYEVEINNGKQNVKEAVKRNDVVYIWFASLHGLKPAYYAKKYGKKLIVAAGGYDTSRIKGYGLASSIKTRWIPKYILSRSDVILAFSNYSKMEIENLVGKKNIIANFGIDTNKFYPKGDKIPMVLTVAYLDKISWKRKGIDMFMDVAKSFPDIDFVVIGKVADEIKYKLDNKPDNVTFTGFLPDEKLLEYYQKTKVYAQFSFHEGFGAVVAEAMLCNAIPVVTDRGALPEVVGDTGVVVYYGSIHSYIAGIEKALKMENTDKPRKRIIENYSLEKREELLKEII